MGRNKKLYTFDELNAQAERIDQAAKLSSVVRKEIENMHHC